MPLLEDAAKSSDRALAARALLYLGRAQERTNKAQARKTYQRIVNEFSDQSETAAAAHALILGLGNTTASPNPQRGLICTDCVANPKVALSRDGRWLAVPEPTSGHLTIRELSTGHVTTLTDTKALHPVFSPDAQQIAYACCGEPHRLFIMPNQVGATPRLLVSKPEFQLVVPTGWSLDGASLLVQIELQNHTWQTAWVSVADGGMKVVKSLDWRREERFDQRAALSPDGRYIAYAALITNPSKPGAGGPDAPEHIYVTSADGNSEVQLTTTAGLYGFPTWTPDGTHLIFTSARSKSTGPIDLWSIPVKDGKATGQASILKTDVGKVGLIGVAPSGSLYYVLSRSALSGTVVASVPIGRATSEPLRRTHTFASGGAWFDGVWSPDGRFMAGSGSVSPPCGSNRGCASDVRIDSVETGAQQVYTLAGSLASGNVRWLHDGSAVLVEVQDEQTRSWSLESPRREDGVFEARRPTGGGSVRGFVGRQERLPAHVGRQSVGP